MKQIMINSGHKGLTQSSTFNGYANSNQSYQPQYLQNVHLQQQYQTQGGQYTAVCY